MITLSDEEVEIVKDLITIMAEPESAEVWLRDIIEEIYTEDYRVKITGALQKLGVFKQ
jgi:hypothetical protein